VTEDSKGELVFSVKLELVEGECEEVKAPQPGTQVDDVRCSAQADLKDFTKLPLQNDLPYDGCEDMCQLNYLHEPAILYNLRRRFYVAQPYTYTGPICIAVNPYQWLDIYSDEIRGEYMQRERESLPPHVYSVSASAFYKMRKFAQNQSILVSGESGAGKTETVKIMMNHLASAGSGKSDHDIIDRVLQSNPLLESFGNAKTVRNDNSSRFGKFTQLQFDKDAAVVELTGSRCQHYLLEKTRVVSLAPGERTYHIFYQLMALPHHQRVKFQLNKSSSQFSYTSSGDTKTNAIEGHTDAEKCSMTTEALRLIGIEEDEITALYCELSAILFIGEIRFEESGEATAVSNPDVVDHVSKLLGVKSSAIASSLCARTMKTVGETITVNLTTAQAADARDGLAKELYSKTFDWLVAQINNSTASKRSHSERLISLLDIFGFESFKINRFEQLCINFANEKLQQRFTQDVFKNVQVEYTEEGISWDVIDFVDNADILDLIEGRMGIISVLNEECIRPKGNDEGFASKVTTKHKDHPRFKIQRLAREDFTLNHYAGPVRYTTTGFIEKNKDIISEDIQAAVLATSVSIVRQIMQHKAVEPALGEGDAANAAAASTPLSPRARSGSTGGPGRRRKGGMMAETVTTKFKNQLNSLMAAIAQTDVQYVRCIKPNRVKSSSIMNNAMVVDQLRCAGVIEAIRISRAGFPNRVLHSDFVKRFSLLTSPSGSAGSGRSTDDLKGACAVMLAALFAEADAPPPPAPAVSGGGDAIAAAQPAPYQVGKTKVFFKAGVLELLEDRRNVAIQERVEVIQRLVRGHLVRVWYSRVRRAVRCLQCAVRMRAAVRVLRQAKHVALVLQCMWRGRSARQLRVSLLRQRAALLLQSVARRWLCADLVRSAVQHVTRVQAVVRMKLARAAYLVALEVYREEAKLENQMKALQAQMLEKEEVSRNKEELLTKSQEMIEAMQKEIERLRREKEELKQENQTLKVTASQASRASIDSARTTAMGKELAKAKEENEALKQDIYQLTVNKKSAAALHNESLKLHKELKDLRLQLDQKCEEMDYQKEIYKDQVEMNAINRQLLDSCVLVAQEYGASSELVEKLRSFALPSHGATEEGPASTLESLEERVAATRVHQNQRKHVSFLGSAWSSVFGS